MKQQLLVNFQNFIAATRDSGYKSTASALAELVDNSLEAKATKIAIQIEKVKELESEHFEISVSDNGIGMSLNELNVALQFGGSTRFNSRNEIGRYGMGLPNSSLSQCRRVEVKTWRKEDYLFNYLDVDEIIDNQQVFLPNIKKLNQDQIPPHTNSGTIVRWRKCDRLSFKYLKSLLKHIHFEFGRIFRYPIWRGIEITICGEKVVPFDPLFMGEGSNFKGGLLYGKELRYYVKIPSNEKQTAEVKVRFVELPVNNWAKLSNEEKQKNQITKNAGVSIIRWDREIDYGWYFMGSKRKENYDDWWRCEIKFGAELDEVFGVTHTKQEIKQTEFLNNILVPDFENIARVLNSRVRHEFIRLKKGHPTLYAKQQLERTDLYLHPLNNSRKFLPSLERTVKIKGLKYEILVKELNSNLFFDVEEFGGGIKLIINKNHLFYEKVFKALHNRKINTSAGFIKILEVLLFSAARSEFLFQRKKTSDFIKEFKKVWSSQLKAFVS